MPALNPLPASLEGSAFRYSTARDAGLTRAQLRSPGVARLFRDVHLVGAPPVDVAALCRSYAVRMRADEAFSHRTAARLYGIPLPEDANPEAWRSEPLHVAVPLGRSRPQLQGVVAHRLSSGSVALRTSGGLAVVAAADVWVQLAAELSGRDLVAAGDFLLSGDVAQGRHRAPIATLEELSASMARHVGARGMRRAAWALPLLRSGVDSRPESLLRLLLIGMGLPEPLIGHATRVRGGRVLRPDLKLPQWRTVFEYEGAPHWGDRRVFLSDIERRELFEEAGWRVVRVTSDHLFANPAALRARVRRILAARDVLRWSESESESESGSEL